MSFDLLLTPLEKALNYYLHLDPEAIHKFAPLNGKVISIELTDLPIKIYLKVEQDEIHLFHIAPEIIHTTLKSTSWNFIKYAAMSTHDPTQVFKGQMEISGDIEVGQMFQRLFSELHIDWEEYLSRFVGDIAAHQIGNFCKDALSWGQSVLQSTTKNVTEYLQEEQRFTPTQEEINDFYDDMDDLRSNMDRCNARVQRIQKNFEEDFS
ncbi:MAG: SCP2 sterol-binding domain-containing protein [Proteobacteria bacterium]|nr:SCP2 sterol-binding domain-containing protein [Pseudomonadota bacterium]